MRIQFCLKSWRISAGVLLAALAVVASTSQAFAQGQPGEVTNYSLEQVNTAGRVRSQGTLAEARNGGNLLDVWLAAESTQVFLSYNNGAPFTISAGTQTFVSPTVVPFGPSNFLVFHTGIDGNIYYAAVSGPNNATGWIQVRGNTTDMSVSVAQIGAGSRNIYMVYRGAGSDPHVYGIWMNAQQEWSSPINVAGGLAAAAPAICLNNTGSSLWVAVIGTDNQLWTTSQRLGAPSWPFFTPRGVYTGPNSLNRIPPGPILAPSCAATANGDVVMAYVDGNDHPNYAVFFDGGGLVSQWTEDLASFRNNWQTPYAVNLSSSGNTVYSLFTSLQVDPTDCVVNCHDNEVWWKLVYNP
jgi:hypothetical protein